MLIVRRAGSRYRDSARAYNVWVDGKEVGNLLAGEQLEVPVAPGRHVLVVRIDWTGSSEVEFVADPQQPAVYEVGPAPSGFLHLFTRDGYLQLTEHASNGEDPARARGGSVEVAARRLRRSVLATLVSVLALVLIGMRAGHYSALCFVLAGAGAVSSLVLSTALLRLRRRSAGDSGGPESGL